MKPTTEEVLADIRALRARDCNTAARGINTEYSNIEYSNTASNTAADATKYLSRQPTSSPLGERTSSSEGQEEGFVGQEEEVIDIPARDIVNPAAIWGIEAQLCSTGAKRVKRSKFYLTIQFNYQLPLQQAANITGYTYPTDRLREYAAETTEETDFYDYIEKQKALGRIILPGRFTTRGNKGSTVDGLLFYIENKNNILEMTLFNTAADEVITLVFDREPSELQKQHFSKVARYGNSLDIPGKRRRISIFEINTLIGGAR